MKRTLFRYEDFLLESNIEMLLEAKIRFSDKFISVLDSIGGDTAEKVLGLANKEIDVNNNYIDIIVDKEGLVEFIPDDKAEKQPLWVTDNAMMYTSTSDKLSRVGKYPIENIKRPLVGQEVKIVKEFTNKDEFFSLFPEEQKTESFLASIEQVYIHNGPILHIQFEDSEGTHNVLCNPDGLKRDISSITPSQVKVGKLITSMFVKGSVEFSTTEVEDFVNKYKSAIKQIRSKFDNFTIVKGEEIRRCYLEDNYLSIKGTLGTSCMRKENCQKFLDIYVENEDKVSLVVLMEHDNITARAILWIDSEGRKIMDRIYTNDSSDEQLFKDYAKANGFFYKKLQNMYEDTPFVDPYGVEHNVLKIVLKPKDYKYYPYMDSFKFYNPNTGVLYNDDGYGHEYTLTDTDGGNGECDECGGGGRITCGTCDGDCDTNCLECGGNGRHECGDCDGGGKQECGECEGSGKVPGDDGEEEDCGECGGNGDFECTNCDGEGDFECEECGGGGTITCWDCEGDGDVNCPQCY
jgi:hypothetical protein